jgi:hypothetical protein
MNRPRISIQWAVLLAVGFAAWAAEANPASAEAWVESGRENHIAGEPVSLVLENQDFNRENLLAPEYRGSGSGSVSGFQLLSPARFSMRQSYSMGFGMGGGSSYSSGLYLNTLSYQLASPLTLSVDVGFHTPFYSSFSQGPSQNLLSGGMRPSVVLPRIGLDYKPTENTSISLQLINGPDAYKAYGSPYGLGASPFWRGF